MDSRKIKYELALSCKGNLNEYFNKVEIINNKIKCKNNNASVKNFIHTSVDK